MKSKIALFLELAVALLFVSMLSGCFGDGGGANYDGTWTVAYGNTAFVPPVAISGASVSCGLVAIPTVTLSNGIGSTSQTNRCDQVSTTTGLPIAGASQDYIYLISVAITNSTGVMNAIVNGGALTGQCISANGCSAQAGTQTLSLTR